MKYFIAHHQHKGIAINNALRKEGWVLSRNNVDVALFDHTINKIDPGSGRGFINRYYGLGATVVTYPHGATGSWWMDNSDFKTDAKVSGNLVIGEGHKYVEKIIQPNLEHYVIGWSYCEIKEFQKKDKVKTILFAPTHTSLKGRKLREEAITTNSKVYESLIKLIPEYRIVVRYLDPLDKIGLWKNSKVLFKLGKPDGSYDDIDSADLVIAEGTYMYLSVARGKPTIGMNQHIPIRPNDSDKSFKLNHWDEYGEYRAYPIDFYDSNDIRELIDKASFNEQIEWKKLFIGNMMDSKHLSDLLKRIRKEDVLHLK